MRQRNQAGQQGNRAITSERYPGLPDQQRNDRGSGSLSRVDPRSRIASRACPRSKTQSRVIRRRLQSRFQVVVQNRAKREKLAAVPMHPSQIATRISSGPFEFIRIPAMGTSG